MSSIPPTFLAPPALEKGARIAIIAPSSPFEREAFEQGIARLRQRYDVRYDEGLFERKGYLAGTDDRRADELLSALADPEVAAIVAARGGYGSTRLLPRIDVAHIRSAGKVLVGFSDVTALHALWAHAGLRSLHASMVAGLGRSPASMVERWIAMLEGASPSPLTGLQTIREGVARGPLLGGNLAVLAALAGTPFAPPLEGAVLFLEDTSERPYRLDRMLTTLEQAGWYDRVAAVLLGAFTEAPPGPDGITPNEVLRERLGRLGVPVVAGIPSGHVDDNLELPFGAPVEVDGDSSAVRFLEPATRPAGSF